MLHVVAVHVMVFTAVRHQVFRSQVQSALVGGTAGAATGGAAAAATRGRCGRRSCCRCGDRGRLAQIRVDAAGRRRSHVVLQVFGCGGRRRS